MQLAGNNSEIAIICAVAFVLKVNTDIFSSYSSDRHLHFPNIKL